MIHPLIYTEFGLSRHGGLLDYPKQVVESAQLISRKWDLCLANLNNQVNVYNCVYIMYYMNSEDIRCKKNILYRV